MISKHKTAEYYDVHTDCYLPMLLQNMLFLCEFNVDLILIVKK